MIRTDPKDYKDSEVVVSAKIDQLNNKIIWR